MAEHPSPQALPRYPNPVTSFLRDWFLRAKFYPLSGGSNSKESACNAGNLDSIPGLGRSPGGRHGNPLQYSCLANSYGQRSLAGYSLRGRKESDMTEQLTTQINTHRGLCAVHHPELTIQSAPVSFLQILILLYFFFSVS